MNKLAKKNSDYTNPDEKNAIFDRREINSFDELIAELQKLDQKGVYFRGQQSALWKIVSSARRAHDKLCHENDCNCYYNTAANLLRSVKRKLGVNTCDQKTNDFALLSLFQHYGITTPLIDFSRCYKVALYFATNNIDADTVHKQPAGMFSIYAFDTCKVNSCYCNDWVNLKNLVQNPGPDFYEYNLAKKVSCIYLEETTPEFIYIDNKRLNRQLGLFVHLGEDSKNLSLEEYCNKGKNELAECGQTDSLLLPSIINIDVPLTLSDQVKQHLDSCDINAKTLGLL